MTQFPRDERECIPAPRRIADDAAAYYHNCAQLMLALSGGETGIRTLGGLAPTTVFETAPFDHSGTSPRGSEPCV